MPANKGIVDSLTYDEKVALMDALWDSLLAEEPHRGTPAWHKEIISQRLERMKSSPHPGFTIDEVFAKVRTQLSEKAQRERVSR